MGGNLLFFLCQAVLIPRLWHKRYRSFHVGVIRTDGSTGAKLSLAEIAQIARPILWPQLILLLVASALVFRLDASIEMEGFRQISTGSQWIRQLIVGPYAIFFALGGRYRTFRLQAYGYRFV
jgi:hypothetical protein